MTKTIAQFVQDEIIYNQTSLVNELLGLAQSNSDANAKLYAMGFDWDKVDNYGEYIEYSLPHAAYMNETKAEVGERLDKVLAADDSMPDKQATIEALKAALEQDGDYPEIFSWYLVTDWLAERLREEGECVLETEGGTYWGRCTFGQLIESDSVIQTIYNNLITNN